MLEEEFNEPKPKEVFRSEDGLIGSVNSDGHFILTQIGDPGIYVSIEKRNDLFRLADQLTLAGMAMMQERTK